MDLWTGWGPSPSDYRARLRAAQDIGTKLLMLEYVIDRTWWGSKLRARTDDGDRMEVKDRRKARALRLFVHLTIARVLEASAAEVARYWRDPSEQIDAIYDLSKRFR